MSFDPWSNWSREQTWKHAAASDCCSDGAWRGHLCRYHEGMEDGMEEVIKLLVERRITPADLGERLSWHDGCGTWVLP